MAHWKAKIDHVDFCGVGSQSKHDELYALFQGREVEVECGEDDIEAVLREMFAAEAQYDVEEVEFSYSEDYDKTPRCEVCYFPAEDCDCENCAD